MVQKLCQNVAVVVKEEQIEMKVLIPDLVEHNLETIVHSVIIRFF